jgi:hypothetical protein
MGVISAPGLFESERSVQGISEAAPLLTVVGGVDIPVSNRFVLLAEGRYQIAFTEGDTTGQATVRGGVRIGL